MAPTVSLAELQRIIREARELIADGTKWTQGREAVNEDGEDVPPNSPDATHFCAIGAVCHVMGMERSDYQDAVYQRVQDMLDAAAEKVSVGLVEAEVGRELFKEGCTCDFLADHRDYCDYCDAMEDVGTYSSIVDLNDDSSDALANVLKAFDLAAREVKRAKAAARA